MRKSTSLQRLSRKCVQKKNSPGSVYGAPNCWPIKSLQNHAFESGLWKLKSRLRTRGRSSIKRPGVFFLGEIYPAFKRGRRLYIRGRRLFLSASVRAIQTPFDAHAFLARMASLGSDYYKKASVVKGHHIYKASWTPVIGEELPAAQAEDRNDHDEHAVAVTKGA